MQINTQEIIMINDKQFFVLSFQIIHYFWFYFVVLLIGCILIHFCETAVSEISHQFKIITFHMNFKAFLKRRTDDFNRFVT